PTACAPRRTAPIPVTRPCCWRWPRCGDDWRNGPVRRETTRANDKRAKDPGYPAPLTIMGASLTFREALVIRRRVVVLLEHVQRSRARFGTAVENVLDVVEQAIANRIVPAVRLVEEVPFVIPDHSSPDNDVPLAGEEVGERAVFAAAAEEGLQPGGVPEDDKMTSTCLQGLIIEQLFCSVSGAVDDNILLQVLDLLPVRELLRPEPNGTPLEIGNQFRQQNAGIDEPRAVFASNLVRVLE